MNDVKSWLVELGLDQYAELLAQHAVEWDVLPDLSDRDLANLGIPLGHRKRLLKAIDKLRQAPVAAPTPEAPAAAPVPERRNLTVLFCDLVGSTALSRSLDPEDLRPIIRSYQDCCAGIVARLDGFVCRYVGDGILIYFGYPRAHEDDAERALRASLEIIDAVGKLPTKTGNRLETRIGVTTGLVVVGELIGQGLAQEVAAIGDAPNIAARLLALAQPNTIVVDRTTRQLSSGLLEFADLGEQTLKGIAEPVQTFRLIGERKPESRFEAMRAARLVPFFNRDHERAILLDRWELAKEGEGQLVLISGEPGIGKSRLVQAFEDRLADDAHAELHYYASPYHQSTALYPFVDQVRRAAGLAAADSPAEKLDKIAAYFAGSAADLEAAVAVFAGLLSIPTPGHDTAELTPQSPKDSAKDKAFNLIIEHMTRLSAGRPLLVVVEDGHWIDPTSLELLDLLADRIERLPVLLLVTYRSDAALPLEHREASLVKLNRLRRPDCQGIIEHLAARKTVPAKLMNEIVTRADGVALFVEELTKAMLESEILVDRGDRYELTSTAPTLAIPTTLNGSLMARLDRNPQTREIAQVGAVIGREFSYEMIAAVSQWPDAALRDALDRLVESEILLRSGASPLTTFRFRHALVQDAAYESLLLSTRRTLHARVAELIEARFPDAVATEPALLAHHFTRAGLSEKAIAYCLSAARLAIARSAMAEAIAALRAGLQLLPDLPAEADARRAELELQVMLGSALRATRAPSAPETGQAWERARALCQDARDTPYLLQVLYGQFLFHQGNGNLAQARRLGEELLALVSTQNDPRALVRGHSAIGRTAFSQGDLATACAHLEQALAVDDAALREGASSIQGPESRVLDLCYLSWALFIQGRCTRALERCRESIDLAEDLAEPYDLVVAYGNACYLHQFRRDRGAVARCAETVIALASEQGFPAWLSLGQIFRGWARAEGDQRGAGLSLVEQALADHTATGERLEVPYLMSLLVECLAERGRLQEGRAALAEAMALAESTGEAWFDAELHRLEGEILLREARGDAAAIESFQRALDIARTQGARTWELRAGLSLARLLIAKRKRAAGHALLEPMLRAFEAEFGLADLDEARRLLTADR